MTRITPLFLRLLLLLILVGFVVVRLNWHKKQFEFLSDSSLESSDGYIHLTLNLAKEMEAGARITPPANPGTGLALSPNPFNEIVLSDPLVQEDKIALIPEDPLNLKGILQHNDGEFIAVFEYTGHEFRVRAGERLLGRSIRKITSDKVYLNSNNMLYLYLKNGKKLAKKKIQ